MNDTPQSGMVVKSVSGRDMKRYFLVVGMETDEYVLISDGDLRRIEKPKRKKIKHLAATPDISKELQDKLQKGERITNSEIRDVLSSLGYDYKHKA